MQGVAPKADAAEEVSARDMIAAVHEAHKIDKCRRIILRRPLRRSMVLRRLEPRCRRVWGRGRAEVTKAGARQANIVLRTKSRYTKQLSQVVSLSLFS